MITIIIVNKLLKMVVANTNVGVKLYLCVVNALFVFALCEQCSKKSIIYFSKIESN